MISCLNSNFNNLTKSNTLAIKGVCSILIIFHHLGLAFGFDGIPANISNYFGSISVGFFFFFSAYGLCMQYKKYGAPYLKKILLVKIPKLYVYLLIVNIIYYFAFEYALMEDTFLSGLMRILGLDWTRRPNQDAWYLYTLIVMYALFAGVFSLNRFIKNKNVTIVVMAIIPFVYLVVLEIVSELINYRGLWIYHRNIQLFSLGIIYAFYKTQIDRELHRYYRPLVIGLMFICVLGLQYYCEDVVSIAVVSLIVILCMFVSLSNVAITFWGKISLQIYIVQRMFIRLFSSFSNSTLLYTLSVLVCTILIAAIIYYLDLLLNSLIKKFSGKIKTAT